MICTVIDNSKGVREERPLHIITFQSEVMFDYKSGDLLDIIDPEHPNRNRQYSIAGRLTDDTYQLLVRDAGIVGSYLCNLLPGESFDAEYIGGVFHPQEDSIFIASGSGYAPFRDFLSTPSNSIESVKLFLNLDSIEEVDEIVLRIGDCYNVISENYDKHKEIVKEHASLFPPERAIYVCGSSRYVEGMCSFLVYDLGLDPLQIQTDVYGAAVD